jgi:1-phosphofructokinase
MGRVMVFAPSIQLTVTIESHGGDVDLHVHPGGQGVWQSRMLSVLGAETVLCTTLGGETGRVLGSLLEDEPFTVRAVPGTAGSGWYVHDRRGGPRRTVSSHPGQTLNRHQVDELYTLALGEGLAAGVAVLGGPTSPSMLPPDVYRRLASDLRAHGVRLIVDLVGEFLDSVLWAGATVVKIADDELVASGRAADASEESLYEGALGLRRDGADAVVVSRAEEPALFLLGDEASWIASPKLQATDPRGAGDSMTAGVAATLATGGELRHAVCTGAAAGAVSVTRHGLGTGHADAIAQLAARVEVTPYGRDR